MDSRTALTAHLTCLSLKLVVDKPNVDKVTTPISRSIEPFEISLLMNIIEYASSQKCGSLPVIVLHPSESC